MLAGGDKDLRAKALEAANTAPKVSPAPTSSTAPSGDSGFSVGGFSVPTSMSSFPSAFGSAPATPSAGMALAPTLSKSGKPMPIQDPEPEL